MLRASWGRSAAAVFVLVLLCACSGEDSPERDVGMEPGAQGGVSGDGFGTTTMSGGATDPASMMSSGSNSSMTSGGDAASGAAGSMTGGQAGGSPDGSGQAPDAQDGASGTEDPSGQMSMDGAGGSGGVDGSAGIDGAAGMAEGSAGAGDGSMAPDVGCEVSPISDAMRGQYRHMDEPYYEKFASANGVIVASGSGVSDEALTRYCRLLNEMMSNDDVREAVIADEMWFTMIAEDEQLSSLPQIDRMYGTSLNRRARGLGGLTPTICAEDSIMCMPGDPWNGDCICPHEAGHTLYSSGIARVPELSSRLSEITRDVRASGRLANAYVWMDGNESGMMAWGVQAWYDCAVNGTNGAYHSDINTRAELQQELPEFYEFLSELLPADNEYQDCYAK